MNENEYIREDIVTDDRSRLLCKTIERIPTRSQRLGYSGLIRSGYSPDKLRVWVFGPSRRPRVWRKCNTPSAEPIPDDETTTRAAAILADLSRASRRYGRHAEDVAQEAFRLIWEGITGDNPQSWIDLDDYKGTLRKAVRRARQSVVFRHVPPPLHRLLALQSPPDSTLYDGPTECFEALSRIAPDMPAMESALLSVAASMGIDRAGNTSEQWEALAEMISAAEGKANVITKSSVERRLGLARVFVILGSLVADSVE